MLFGTLGFLFTVMWLGTLLIPTLLLCYVNRAAWLLAKTSESISDHTNADINANACLSLSQIEKRNIKLVVNFENRY